MLRVLPLLVVPLALGVGGCSTVSKTLAPFGLTYGPGYAYDVRIVGVGGELEERLKASSVLFSKKYEPPGTLQGLRRRTQADRDIYLRVLRSRGFYDGTVLWHIDSSKKPAIVEMRVTRGERYKISRVDIEGIPSDAASLSAPDAGSSLGLAVGEPALAETVLAAESRLIVALATDGYPFAELPLREVRIDRLARTMEIHLRVDAGPHAKFGEVTVEGLKTVKEDLVRRRLKFARGDPFSPSRIEETRKDLFSTGVFSAITLTWGKRGDVGPDGEAPIHILVAEGKMHTIGAGLKYSSADGPGGRVFWEDRNVRGGAEKLRTEAEYSEQIATGGISYRKPDWYRVGQSLLLEAKADADKPPAYDRYALSASVGLERAVRKHFVGTAGLLVEQSDVQSQADRNEKGHAETKQFTLLGIPLGLRYDGSDNLLDPSRGHRTLASMSPYFSVLGDKVLMLALRVTESIYIPIDEKHRYVWASRVSLGSVIGPERNDTPADKRLYAGGGDSVRGYQFQYVGPLCDINNFDAEGHCRVDGGGSDKHKYRPLGGRSLLQVGTELRWKVTKTIGIVPFFEGAGIYEPSYPDFQDDIQWAAGLGFRYFTVAGPIRLDFGFPVNPRPSDSIFQLYISLGQAF